jgi:hypothetical protein
VLNDPVSETTASDRFTPTGCKIFAQGGVFAPALRVKTQAIL